MRPPIIAVPRGPSVRYALYYLASISLYSFLLAFFPLYLDGIGMSAGEIALLSAAATLATMIGTPSALRLAHSSAAPRTLMLLCAAAALLSYLPLLAVRAFVPIVIAWFLCIAFKRGCDGLVDSQAVRDSAAGRIRFERVRGWGSIGFVVTTVVIGAVVDYFGTDAIPRCGLVICVLIAIFSAGLRPSLSAVTGRSRNAAAAPKPASEAAPESPAATSARPKRYRTSFVSLLIASALIAASHSTLYVYFSLYLEHLGWSPQLLSLAWNIGVLAEILFFFTMAHIEHRFDLLTILRLSIGATIVRWLILASSSSPWVILPSQLLHGLSFAGCYAASIKLVYLILPEDLRDRGQGWLTAFGSSVGSLAGRLLVGTAASSLSSYAEVRYLFVIDAAMAALAWVSTRAIKLDPE